MTWLPFIGFIFGVMGFVSLMFSYEKRGNALWVLFATVSLVGAVMNLVFLILDLSGVL